MAHEFLPTPRALHGMLARFQRQGLPDERAPSGFSAFARYGALLVVKNRDLNECTVTTEVCGHVPNRFPRPYT